MGAGKREKFEAGVKELFCTYGNAPQRYFDDIETATTGENMQNPFLSNLSAYFSRKAEEAISNSLWLKTKFLFQGGKNAVISKLQTIIRSLENQFMTQEQEDFIASVFSNDPYVMNQITGIFKYNRKKLKEIISMDMDLLGYKDVGELPLAQLIAGFEGKEGQSLFDFTEEFQRRIGMAKTLHELAILYGEYCDIARSRISDSSVIEAIDSFILRKYENLKS